MTCENSELNLGIHVLNVEISVLNLDIRDTNSYFCRQFFGFQ